MTRGELKERLQEAIWIKVKEQNPGPIDAESPLVLTVGGAAELIAIGLEIAGVVEQDHGYTVAGEAG